MPQASEADRAWAREKFGSIDTSGPISFLQKAGYVLRDDRPSRTDGIMLAQTARRLRAIVGGA